jgi:SAM-dependent methyltransferase
MNATSANPQIATEQSPCPVCGTSDKRVLVPDLVDVENRSPGTYEIAECTKCRLVYTSVRPTAESLPLVYQNAYHAYDSHRAKSWFASRLYTMRNQLRERAVRAMVTSTPRSVLEVGCGNAEFLLHLEQTWGPGVTYVGNDYETSAIRLPADSKIRLVPGDLENLPFNEQYDLILLYDVLEHTRFPGQVLRKLASCLAPGGTIVVQVPNWDSPCRRLFPRHWGGLQIPRHQVFFTPDTLVAALRAEGFQTDGAARIFDPGEISVTLSNWVTDKLKLSTLPRQSPMFLGFAVLFAPLAMLWSLLGISGEMRAIARKPV